MNNPTLTRALQRPALALGACLLAWAAAAPALAQDVELFDRADFAGTRLTLGGVVPDLSAYGLAGRVSSAIIHRGQWEFCTQAQFRGACVTAGPGRYARLPAALNDAVVSMRPAGATAPVQPPHPGRPDRPDRPSGPYRGVGALLFGGDFNGPEVRVTEAVRDLRSLAFNDSAVAVELWGAEWELCSDGGFGGRCLRLPPGRHLLPPALRHELSSLRPVGAQVSGPGPVPPRPPVVVTPGRPWGGATPSIVFYEHSDFAGRQLPLATAATDFNAMDFNDRASAVEIFRGRWELCRHANFGGECRVFGPGRYQLGGGLHDAVSSARPLSGRGDRPFAPHGAVTLHDQHDLRGRSLLVEDEVNNLRDLGYNDRATAIEVHAGRWELCSSSYFRGRCEVFGPGWWRLPEGLAGELSSLRPR